MLDHEDSGIFPDDIISEILTRLPAKTIHRFKCVSKRWNSIICNPNFITSYIAKSSQKWAILDRSIGFDPKLETEFKLPLEQPPNVSTLSLNPTKLSDDLKVVLIKDHKFPAPLITSSNGLILLSVKIKRNLSKEKNATSCSWVTEDDSLYVVNPITREWVPIPKPPHKVQSLGSVGFITEVGPTGVLERFLIVEYQPIVGSKSATLMCFSSETGKWDEILATYMLGMRIWNGDGVTEFDGHLLWVDWSVGMLAWDEPFRRPKKNEKVCFRFIALPRMPLLSDARRCVGVGGGHIQYLEVFKGGSLELCLWRLKDYQSGEWILVHKLCLKHIWSDYSYLGYGLEKALPQTLFIHPFEADIAVLMVGNRVFCLNFRTRKVECCGSAYSFLNEYTFIGPVQLPTWPTLFSPSFKATFLKEQGNEYMKAMNFNEAISCYSRSIALSPNTLAYANRAMAYLNINRFYEAQVDCTEALKIDSEYFKVYWRRAIARKELGDFKGCVKDVEFALKLKPDDQKLKKLYAEVKSLIDKANSSVPMPTASSVQNDADIKQDNGTESDFAHGGAA